MRTARDRFWEFPARAPWALRLVQVQLSVVYVSTVWQKLQGHTWLEGTAVSYASDRRTSCALRCRALSADRPVASAVLTYGTLALELSVGILIWSPRARRFVLVPAILLHVLVDATLAAGLISAAMLTAFVAFVPPQTATRWICSVHERTLRRFREPEALGGT